MHEYALVLLVLWGYGTKVADMVESGVVAITSDEALEVMALCKGRGFEGLKVRVFDVTVPYGSWAGRAGCPRVTVVALPTHTHTWLFIPSLTMVWCVACAVCVQEPVETFELLERLILDQEYADEEGEDEEEEEEEGA